MKCFPFLLLSFFLLCSCGDSSRKTTEDSAKIITGDTLAVTGGDSLHAVDTSLVLFHFDQRLSLSDDDKLPESLPVKEVRKRFWPLDAACNEDAQWTLKRFFVLDSLRRKGPYNGDIGEITDVIIHPVDTLQVSKNFITVAWLMYRRSYPACPFSIATYYMLTTYRPTGERISSQLLGKSESAADAPVTFSSDETALLFRDGTFSGVHADTSDCGEDDPKPADCVEITHYTYKGRITADGHILRTNEKQQ